MSDRYYFKKDYDEDCLSIVDTMDEVKTAFGSEIVLSPLADAEIIADELNKNERIIMRLREELKYNGYVNENIDEIIETVLMDY